jgi:hypothetical protein
MDKSDFEYSGRCLRWYEWLTFLLLLFFVTGVRAVPIYKCINQKGDVAYQDQPCTVTLRSSVVEVAPAPAYAKSPEYAVEPHPVDNKSVRSERNVASRRSELAAAPQAMSYECRSTDGQVFYRHSACPRTVAAKGELASKGRASAKTVPVHSTRVSREEACMQMRRAGASGRSGHMHDDDISTYEKDLGHDPCR